MPFVAAICGQTLDVDSAISIIKNSFERLRIYVIPQLELPFVIPRFKR